MTERGQIERALRACADAGVPRVADPWPEIRERALARRGRAPLRNRRIMPRTRVRLMLAVLLCAFLGMGAYSASGLLDAIFQDKLPGGDAVDLGQKLDLTQTANGMRVTLERAYADQSSVVVGYTIEELEEDRQALGYPTRLEPSLEQEMVLTDGSGARLQNAEGPEWSGSDEDVPVVAVFEAGEGTEVGERERFRLEAPIGARLMVPPETTGPEASGPADDDLPYQVETGDPFVFDFEVPVRAAPTVQVDQKVEAGGVTLTLDRVIDSPARPEAVFCFEPPDDEREWYIRDLTGGSSIVPNEDNCRAYVLRSGLERRSTLTVTRIEGIPRPGTFRNDKEGNQKVRTIRGPWTFEFEVPER